MATVNGIATVKPDEVSVVGRGPAPAPGR